MISATSRYSRVGRLVHTGADGRKVLYLVRRLPPQPEAVAVLSSVPVTEDTRLDTLAYRFFGDPKQSWRIADANAALDPFELIAEPGRHLRIPRPGG
jgi:hypothetical protein